MSTEGFKVQLGSRTAGHYLMPASFCEVKAYQRVRIGIAKSGEQGFTDLILEATSDAREQPGDSGVTTLVIEGAAMHPRVSGRVVLRYIPEYGTATLTPVPE